MILNLHLAASKVLLGRCHLHPPSPMSLNCIARVAVVRPFSQVVFRPITITVPQRQFSSTFLLASSARGPHPTRHDDTAKMAEGVADHAVEDDTTKTGLPQESQGGLQPSEHRPSAALPLDPLSPSSSQSIPEADPVRAAPLAARSTPDLFSLRGRTVIVTGGARGLGLTIAQACLESGAHVSAFDLLPHPSESEWPAVQAIASERGLSLSYGQLDITDQSSVQSNFQQAFDSAPSSAPVRGLYHSAGIQLLMPALDYKPEQVRKIIDVNTTGSFLVAQAFAQGYS